MNSKVKARVREMETGQGLFDFVGEMAPAYPPRMVFEERPFGYMQRAEPRSPLRSGSGGSIGVMGALAVGCSLMSAYHEFTFWRWSGRGLIIAALLTLCFVGYNAISLTLWRAQRRWYIAVLGLAVMGFTMAATAISSYELQAAAATVDLSGFDARAALLDKEAADARAAIDAALEQEAAWRRSSWARADAARKAEQAARARLARIRADQEALTTERAAAVAGKADGGLWAALAAAIGGDARVLRFLILMIPALFLDTLPPIMIECMRRARV